MINNTPLSPPFRVYILDDHKFIAEILTQRLSTDPNIKVVGIGNKGSSALHFVRTERVDIALLDMELEDDDGVHVAVEMMKIDPRIRAVDLSAHITNHYPLALLEAGGRGFISKKVSTTEIIEGIRRVARGDMAISPDVAFYLATEVQEAGPVSKVRGLTSRETTILELIGLGYSIHEIADEMNISVKTVQSHRVNMKRKLKIRTDVGLCLLALKAGIIGIRETR